ncbi:DUF1294 domain-containing protein [Sediminibacillus albus]|uniref:Uncharacterized membrane protein YsdA, DUF1294 family n=1 Tax=Sediminibacillus albus TaxID=407036 RepID=A0A1G9BT79_9BACI|nr:DUF1294 domain-containing protein [Sediminibacillus albus]SDK42384.1 Uncharacterized membrane protein YsdA, DUF1294 family [Sediminibacillus albus]
MTINLILFVYLAAINVAAWIVMWLDKRRAVKRQWRIPEKTLWLLAIIGGAAGSFAAMHTFKHKTRRFGFRFGLPALVLLQLYLFVVYSNM